MSIKRYDPHFYEGGMMEEVDDGDWCRWTDAERLRATMKRVAEILNEDLFYTSKIVRAQVEISKALQGED